MKQEYKLGGFVIRVTPLVSGYTRFTIVSNNVPLRKQISAPSLGDCEQGRSDSRHKSEKRGFSV